MKVRVNNDNFFFNHFADKVSQFCSFVIHSNQSGVEILKTPFANYSTITCNNCSSRQSSVSINKHKLNEFVELNHGYDLIKQCHENMILQFYS